MATVGTRTSRRYTAALLAVATGIGCAVASSAGASASTRSDTARPTVTITSPANSAQVANPVTIRGKASDNVGVRRVFVQLQRGDSYKYWNGTAWQKKAAWVRAKVGTAGATKTGWSISAPLPKVLIYATAKAVDAAGNESFEVETPFSVLAPADLSITSMSSNPASLTQGQPASIGISIYNAGGIAYDRKHKVTFTLPESLTATSAAGTGWTCTVAAHSATCTSTESVPAGGNTPSLGVTFDVSMTAPSPVTVTATITAPGQVRPSNDTRSQDFTVAVG